MLRTWIAAALLAGTASAAGPLDLANRRQLFLDHRFLEAARGVRLRVHQPVKTGDILFASEPGWEIGGYNSVMETDGVYRMWYSCGPAICYATSRDGIHWERPALNLTTGDTRRPNNVVLGRGAGGLKGDAPGGMVFLDSAAPAEERFRLATNPGEFNSMLQVYSSPDGIHWRHTHRDVMTFDASVKPHHLDSNNVIFRDPRSGKYVAYFRRNTREHNSQARSVGRAESSELSFGDVRRWPVVFRADDRPPSHFDPQRKGEAALTDIYVNNTIAYPWAEDAYFMFPALYYHYGAFQREFRDGPPVNAGVVDTHFAASRDGVKWETYDWEPFVPLGMQGAFDSRRIYMGYGIVPSRGGGELYMYYMGTNEAHGWGRDDRNNRILTAAGLAPGVEQRVISRVAIRRDGFVSVRAGNGGGEFTTPPLTFRGNQLVLNIDTSASGEAQVEIQDEAGRAIPGFTLADADIIHSANVIDRPVTWNLASTLEKLEGKTIRLRFVLRDTDLYAFQFRDRPAL
ncbi:MAG: hypothetical protein ACE15B_20035 [Bryobacteraceae bacterium]